MAPAVAMLKAVHHRGTRESWVSTVPAPPVKLLEINRAGDLTPWLARLSHHQLVEFPEVNIEALPFPDESWNLVVHSDTNRPHDSA
jgi:hypothetical protein